MKMNKVHIALLLAGLAAGVSVQTSANPNQWTVSDADQGRLQAERGRIQLAQAGGGQNSQGTGQGGPGGPGNAAGGQGGQGGQGSGEHHHGPPPAAIAACKGLASGAGCSFVGRQNQNLSGTCFSPRTDRPLACRPAGGGRSGQGGPGGPGEKKG